MWTPDYWLRINGNTVEKLNAGGEVTNAETFASEDEAKADFNRRFMDINRNPDLRCEGLGDGRLEVLKRVEAEV